MLLVYNNDIRTFCYMCLYISRIYFKICIRYPNESKDVFAMTNYYKQENPKTSWKDFNVYYSCYIELPWLSVIHCLSYMLADFYLFVDTSSYGDANASLDPTIDCERGDLHRGDTSGCSYFYLFWTLVLFFCISHILPNIIMWLKFGCLQLLFYGLYCLQYMT